MYINIVDFSSAYCGTNHVHTFGFGFTCTLCPAKPFLCLYRGLLFTFVCKSQKLCIFTLIYIIQIYFPTFASHFDPIFVILPLL